MSTLKRQRGVSYLGGLILLVIAAFLVVIGLRVVPAYINYYELRGVMQTVASRPDAPNLDLPQFWSHISMGMSINNINGIDRKDFTLKQSNSGQGRVLRVRYQLVKPLIANIDLLFHFNYSVPVRTATP